MKNALLGAVALVALPMAASAQSMFSGGPSFPGFYIGAEGGLNWLLNNNSNTYNNPGFAVGGVIGYDFVGPRVELEGVYRNNRGNGVVAFPPGTSNVNGQINQVAAMANLLYDFAPGATITPYIGAGAGIAFVDPSLSPGCTMCSTQFAYQGILGLSYNMTQNFRVNLDGRYHGTTNPGHLHQQQHLADAGPHLQVRSARSRGCPAGPAGAPARRPSWCSSTGIVPISRLRRRPPSGRRPTPTRPRATPASPRPAIPTSRARKPTTWRCRCGAPTPSRTHWSATACRPRRSRSSAAARAMPLVQTADGVREPQNRRVEIVVQ